MRVLLCEQVFSGVVGKAADVYSLGIILWEMVTGSQPYKDLNEGEGCVGGWRWGWDGCPGEAGGPCGGW